MKVIFTNTALALGLAVCSIAIYRLIGFGMDPEQSITLRTGLDDRIPFWPWSVYLYSWVYTSMLYPLFVVRCPRLFRRVLLAYVIVIGISLVCFALVPVSAIGFRPDASRLDMTVFHNWGVRLTFVVDPPANLFPSLHLTVATIAAFAVFKARPLFGILVAPIVLGIAVSICTLKQHYIVDGLAALLLAGAAFFLVIRPYDPGRKTQDELVFTWRGPLAYLVFHGLTYLGLYIAFRMGFRPW